MAEKLYGVVALVIGLGVLYCMIVVIPDQYPYILMVVYNSDAQWVDLLLLKQMIAK